MDGASRGPEAGDWDGQQLVPNFRSDQAQDLVELPLVCRILLLVDCRGLIKPSLKTEMRIARIAQFAIITKITKRGRRRRPSSKE